MGRHDDQRADGGGNRIHPWAGKADPEHQADEIGQKRPANADDDGLDVSVIGKARLFRRIADDARNDDGSDQNWKHWFSPRIYCPLEWATHVGTLPDLGPLYQRAVRG